MGEPVGSRRVGEGVFPVGDLFAEAQELGRCAAFEWNLETRTIHFSEHTSALLGRAIERFSPDWSAFIGCVHPEDRERVELNLERVLDTGEHQPLFHRVSMPNGEVRSLVLRGRVVANARSEPERLIGFLQDITEQVDRERALQDSRAALNEAQSLGALGHFALHPPGVQIVGSDEFHRLIGTDDGFYITIHTFPDRFLGDDRLVVRRALQKALQEGESFDIEVRLGADASRSRWVRLKTRVEFNDRRFRRVSGIIQDIDHHKQLEAARTQMSRVDALGQLAGGLAHDFNNFLASVLLNLTTLEHDHETLDDDVRSAVRDAVASARAAQLVTRQLMNFSKGAQPILERVELGPLVEESVRFSLRGSGCELHFEDTAESLWVRIDPGQIQQVINNLVLNARQAQGDEGQILVRLTARSLEASGASGGSRARFVEISVQDEGPGVAPEIRDRLFTPYFSTKPEGHGLGLASSYSIVKMHRGDLSFECPPGGGSVFRFTLPITEAPALAPAPTPQIIGHRRGRILVLDDDASVRRVLQRALHRLGYDVELSENGHDTLDAWDRAWTEGEPFDLLVLDLTVSGGIGGIEVFRNLRERHPGIRAIASSGYAHSNGIADCRELGFAGVLPKPYTFEELGNVVANVLSSEGQSSKPPS